MSRTQAIRSPRARRGGWCALAGAAALLAACWSIVAPDCAHAQDKEPAVTEEVQQAREVIEKFYAAWNEADNEKLRTFMNFPFVSMLGAGRVTVDQTPADFTTDFAAMRQREGWHHSTLDKFETTSVSPSSVHCKVTFSRFHPDGSKYMTMTMLYIVTRQNGHWGMQFRTPWGRE